MRFKKLAAFAVAFVMITGIGTAFPADTDFGGIALTASAASDFTIKTNSKGLKYVSAYTGKGGDITIPKEVSFIGKRAFQDNTNITSVTFPATCDFVEEEAFTYCKKLRKVTFEGNADICANAFSNCFILQSVEIKGGIRDGIGSGAFSNCQKLTSVKIKKDINEFWIDRYAFYNCYSLMSINLPSKCTEICSEAFLNCFNLTSLTIPEKTIMNEENDGKNHVGYAELFKTANDCENFYFGDDNSIQPDVFVAGGKSGYGIELTYYAGTSYKSYYDIKLYSPKAITLTVTKGSPAEEWAKENKVKYVYATASSKSGSKSGSGSSSGSGDELAAPTGIKSSKTRNSVTLTWNSISGADAYRVYIYDSSKGKYIKYKDVSGTKCTISGLASGTTYKFKVAALEEVNGKYKAGKSSKPISVKTKS